MLESASGRPLPLCPYPLLNVIYNMVTLSCQVVDAMRQTVTNMLGTLPPQVNPHRFFSGLVVPF